MKLPIGIKTTRDYEVWLYEQQQLKKAAQSFGSPERVYVELDWYDGEPIAGIGLIDGKPHRFAKLFNQHIDEYANLYRISPIEKNVLLMEIEQWQIFIAWNNLYEQGIASVELHPANAGINERWNVLESQLASHREIPIGAAKALAKLIPIDQEKRYAMTGPDYQLAWAVL